MRRLALRLWSFVRSGKADTDLAREIDAHLQLLEDRCRAQGMTPGEARAAARRAFGGQVEQTKLRHRDARSFRWLDESWLDLKLGARMLVKYSGLTIVGGLGMAVAMAISAASFAFFYAYLAASLPLDEGDRVVALENWDIDVNNEERQALHDYADWRTALRSFEEIGAFRSVNRNLIVPGGAAEPVRLAEMTASGFRIARTPPLVGRPLLDDDERPGATPVVVIGADVWRARFGADTAIIGTLLQLGHVRHAIVGVMPDGFAFPVNHSYWIPLRTGTSTFARGEGPEIFIFGRLARGVSVDAAGAELTAVGQRASEAFPQTHGHLRARVLRYADPVLDVQDMSMWWIGMTQMTMSVLLVIVAINVSILVYARTATRQGEIAVRTALGASRPRIVGQLFLEALVLAGGAALVSLALVAFGLHQAHAIMRLETASLPYWIDLGMPWVAIVYVAGLSMLAALLAGAVPAWRATSPRVQSTLRELSGSTGLRLGRTWTALIVGQVALAVAALPVVVASSWSEARAATTRPAFAVASYLAGAFAMDPEPPEGVDPAAYRRGLNVRFMTVQQELLRRLEAEPHVTDVTIATRPPSQESTSRIELERPPAEPSERDVLVNRVDVDFFDAFEARVVAGRRFTSADRQAAGDPRAVGSAVIVNRAFVRALVADGNPLGHRVRYAARDDDDDGRLDASPWHEIVGVVDDLQVNAIDPELVRPALYHPLPVGQASTVSVIVRVSGDTPAAFVNRLREITAAIDPTVRLNVFPLVDLERQANIAFRLIAASLAMVIVTVLLLSAAGIYALMSFTVSQRRKEIGIRVALGADARRLLGSIFARAAGQLGVGVALGLGCVRIGEPDEWRHAVRQGSDRAPAQHVRADDPGRVRRGLRSRPARLTRAAHTGAARRVGAAGVPARAPFTIHDLTPTRSRAIAIHDLTAMRPRASRFMT